VAGGGVSKRLNQPLVGSPDSLGWRQWFLGNFQTLAPLAEAFTLQNKGNTQVASSVGYIVGGQFTDNSPYGPYRSQSLELQGAQTAATGPQALANANGFCQSVIGFPDAIVSKGVFRFSSTLSKGQVVAPSSIPGTTSFGLVCIDDVTGTKYIVPIIPHP